MSADAEPFVSVARDRLIVALDVENLSQANTFAQELGDSTRWLKIGLELFTAEGPAAVTAMRHRGVRIMLDLKLHDIPETVARATARAAALGVELLTVHTSGGWKMMEAAAKAARVAGGGLKLLGVTVLTSLEAKDLEQVGELGAAVAAAEGAIEAVVQRRAQLAMECGLDGVVASPHEARAIRQGAPADFLIVTPGVRLAGGARHDQARVATPREARLAGADMVVVGRPVRDAADPKLTASMFVAELD
jgi:orotidine-5'-phosphate decarboxylase